MAKATYIHKGETVDYTPTAAVTAGQVVELAGARCGVAGGDMAAGELGTLFVTGVFDFPHAAEAADVAMGAAVYWDSANETATATDGGNTPLGWCAAACGKASGSIRVKIG